MIPHGYIEEDDIHFEQETAFTIGQNERMLWAAVLLSALKDALGSTKGIHTPKGKAEAISTAQAFFEDPSPALPRICEDAGMDARIVRRTALKLISEYRDTGTTAGGLTMKAIERNRQQEQRMAA